jgi:chitinase
MKSFTLAYFLALLLPLVSSTAFARPDHVVLGYVPSRRDAIASPEDFDYDAVTHLARAFIREQDDGSLKVTSDFFSPAFEKAAHDHGVKILMSIGGGSSEAAHWQALANDPKHVQTFLDNVAALLKSHPQYDGIDIDWEPPPLTDSDGKAYADFLKSVHAKFPDKILTLALTATKNGLAHIPMDEVIPSIDFFNAMTYSYAVPSSGLATFNGNLHDDPQGAHTRHSVDEGMENLVQLHHVPPAKLLLGMTFWANRYRVDHLGEKYPSHSSGFADSIEYPRALDLLTTGEYTELHDATADGSYIVRTKGGCVITFDDPNSVHDKCEKVKQMKCAGVMIWDIGADAGGGEAPLLSAIDESFGMQPLSISRPALEREVVRLSQRPLQPNLDLQSLLKIDTELRAHRARQDDAQWAASATAHNQK